MSTSEVAIIPQALHKDFSARPRDRWWDRLISRCARPDCPHEGKLWPTRLHKSTGVLFDGRWYCELPCLHPFLEYRLRGLLSGLLLHKPRTYRLPLGLLLVNGGAISPSQLREALRLQRDGAIGRLGDWFLQTGAITEPQLTSALAQQWGCPVFPLDPQQLHPSWSILLPFPLLESARAVPAHASPDGRILYLAFADRVDHALLFATEQMLDCRTLACVARGSAITELLALLRRRIERSETSFDTIRDSREMAWTICNYAEELRARRIAVARVTSHVWVRFYRQKAIRDLLFRILPAKHGAFAYGLPGDATKVFLPSADTRKDGVSDAAEPL